MDELEIIAYSEALRDDFKRLNLAWIQQYFVVEPHDLEQLDDPETHVLFTGGTILFACLGETVVGVCALIQTDPGVFELAKMAVDANAQGRGIGKALGEAAVRWAREHGASRLWLESNRRLGTALRLYERLGFREVPLAATPYARADIKMEMALAIEEG